MVIGAIILCTLVIEVLCIAGRRVFGSKKERIARSKNPVRIHHGEIGLLFFIPYMFYQNDIFLIAAIALILSDAIHHFVVLPLWVKSTEFP
jgi:hypothetical protein